LPSEIPGHSSQPPLGCPAPVVVPVKSIAAKAAQQMRTLAFAYAALQTPGPISEPPVRRSDIPAPSRMKLRAAATSNPPPSVHYPPLRSPAQELLSARRNLAPVAPGSAMVSQESTPQESGQPNQALVSAPHSPAAIAATPKAIEAVHLVIGSMARHSEARCCNIPAVRAARLVA
jgi:hypothetical protein